MVLHDLPQVVKLRVEYFESIYDSRLSEGLVPRCQLDKIRANVKREMRHELRERYDCKLRHFSEQRRTDRSRSVQRDDGRRQRNYGKRREDERHPYDAREKKGPPPREDKGFQALPRAWQVRNALIRGVPCQSAQPGRQSAR